MAHQLEQEQQAGPQLAQLGRSQFGVMVTRYFRPTQKKLADLYCQAERTATPPNQAVPVPQGMSVEWVGRDLTLTLSAEWAAQYRKVYGYIADIKLLPTR